MKIKEWLEGLAKSDTSSTRDSELMEALLRRSGLESAKCVCGIVYPTGYGITVSIHQMAKTLLKT